MPPAERPEFSLIVATLGAASGLPRFLHSLEDNAAANCEILIVDQNDDDRLKSLVDAYRADLEIVHLRSPKGLSVARNIGIRFARGRVLAFPDDDCWYPPQLLQKVKARLDSEPRLAGLTCRCTDEWGRLAAGAPSRRSGLLSRRTVWSRGVSATMFLHRAVVERVRDFDPSLGLGAPTLFQSGEETDYLLRALKADFLIWHETELQVFHPLSPAAREPKSAERARAYGRGMGRVLRVHGYDMLTVAGHVALPCLGSLYALCVRDPHLARVRFERALGRVEGWGASLS